MSMTAARKWFDRLLSDGESVEITWHADGSSPVVRTLTNILQKLSKAKDAKVRKWAKAMLGGESCQGVSQKNKTKT